MKTSLNHLPVAKQRELAHVTQHVLTEFEAALLGATQNWKRQGRVLKLILFGSFARGDWKEDRKSGHMSDFDILVIVNNKKLTDKAEYWYVAEDKIARDKKGVRRPVNLIVHSLKEVNDALLRGQFFFTDIVREGVLLYDLPGHSLATPRPLSPSDALEMASKYLKFKSAAALRLLKLARISADEGHGDPEWRKNAAFNLHQAAETAYHCLLLVRTFYQPKSHNLTFLRSLSEDSDDSLVSVWPRVERRDRRRFELLKEAYVNARYSDEYRIDGADVTALLGFVSNLQDAVEASCQRRLRELEAAAWVKSTG